MILQQKVSGYQEICSMVLDNPLIFVFVGKSIQKKCHEVRKYYGDSNSILLIQIFSQLDEKIPDDKVLGIRVDESGKLVFEDSNLYSIENAIRRTKRHKYMKRGDVNVCMIVDGYDDSVEISDVCSELYKILSEAYFSHVFFDLYYIMSENFLHISQQNQDNYLFLKKTEDIQKKEWIRFIFVLSEMDNEEILIENFEQLFLMVLDSVMLGNCQQLRSPVTPIPIYNSLLESENSDKSKLWTIGRISLNHSETVVKSILRYKVAKELEQFQMPNHKLLENNHIGLEGLAEKLWALVSQLKDGIDSIGYYEAVTADTVRGCTNAEVLNRCFRDNHLKFMKINQSKYEVECLNITKVFCQTQLDTWLCDNLQQSSWNILDLQCLERLIEHADGEIKSFIEEKLEKLNSVKNQFINWKQKKVGGISHHRRKQFNKNYQLAILTEWGENYVEKFFYEILQNCLLDVRYYVNQWKIRICSGCREFLMYQKDTQKKLEILQNDNNRIKKLLFEIYQNKLSGFLEDNKDIIQNCYRDLCSFIFFEEDNKVLIDHVIEKHISAVYEQKIKEFYSWDHWSGNKIEIRKFFEDLYQELMENKILQMRGDIFNIDPFICFMGSSEDSFIQYVTSKNQNVIYNTKHYEVPVILYYQHIDCINHLFIFNSYDKNYGDQ